MFFRVGHVLKLASSMLARLPGFRTGAWRRPAGGGVRGTLDPNLSVTLGFLQSVLDDLPIAVHVKDRHGRYAMVNRELEAMFGLAAGQILGKTMVELMPSAPPEQLRFRRALDERALLEGRAITMPEHEWTSPQGARLILRGVKRPFWDANGRPMGVLTLNEDVTGWRKAEEDLVGSRELLQTVLDAIPVNVTAKDRDRRLTFVNQAFADLHGKRKSELVGTRVHEWPDAGKYREVLALDDEVVNAGEAVQVPEHAGPERQGVSRLVKGVKLPVKDRAGQVVSIVTMLEDVTERRAAERRLQASEALLRTVIDAIPHYLYVKDRSDRFILVNRALSERQKLRGEPLLGLRVAAESGRHPEEVEQVHADNRRVMEQGVSLDFNRTMEVAPYGRRSFHTIKVPLRDGTGEITGLVGLDEDITDRLMAEDRVRENQEFLQAVIDAIPQDLFVKDRDGKVLMVNQTIANRWKKPKQELLGVRGHGLHPLSPEEEQTIDKSDRRVIEEGRAETVIRELVDASGMARMFRVHKVPVKNAAGHTIGLVMTGEDITDLISAQQKIAERDALLRTVIDAIPQRIFAKDTNRRFVLANRATAEWLNLPEDKILGRTLDDIGITPPEILRTAIREDHEVLVSGRTVMVENLLGWGPAQLPRILSGVRLPLRNESGTIVGLVGVLEDVTDKRQAQEALREGRERLQVILDNVVDAVITTDQHGNILTFNRPAERMFGYSEQEVGGRPVSLLVADSHRKAHDAYLSACQEGKSRTPPGTTLEGMALAKDGATFPIDLSIAEFRISGARYFIEVIRDITARKRAEQEKADLQNELNQSQKLESVGRLAGGIAHDFNNLLSPIIGYTELALADLRPDQPHHGDFVEIREAARRAADLVRQLLAFTRRRAPVVATQDLNAEIASLGDMLKRIIGEDIRLTLDLDPSAGFIEAEATLVQQVVVNLVVNARDAMPQGGRIDLRTRRVWLDAEYAAKHLEVTPGYYALLAISDNGTGMDPATLAHIFEPFFTTKDQGKGTGLGLAIVHAAVRSHGGHIAVSSKPGAGSTFEIYLASSKETSVHSTAVTAQSRNGGGHETILVVEDEPVVRRLVCSILARHGYRILEADSPRRALELASDPEEQIDLVLSDIVMPELSGPEMVTRLRQSRPDLRVLYMSGYPDRFGGPGAFTEEQGQLIRKPFELSSLLTAVRSAMEGPLKPLPVSTGRPSLGTRSPSR